MAKVIKNINCKELGMHQYFPIKILLYFTVKILLYFPVGKRSVKLELIFQLLPNSVCHLGSFSTHCSVCNW